MVSKLLLAVQETYYRAVDSGAPKQVLKGLADCYYEIRAGIGDYKTPDVYGAFPMDPYSHTPGHAGARQPGLTGQVKEDLICRMGELGVTVKDGEIHFGPGLLRQDEFVTGPADFIFYDVAGVKRRRLLQAGELAFTCCQVPVIYRLAQKNSLTVVWANGVRQPAAQLRLDSAASREIFERTGKAVRIEVCLSLYSRPPTRGRNHPNSNTDTRIKL